MVKHETYPVSTLWICQNSCLKWPLVVNVPIKNGDFPQVASKYLLRLKMTIEIMDFPIKNGGSFHSYVSHYQRVVSFSAFPKREENEDEVEVRQVPP